MLLIGCVWGREFVTGPIPDPWLGGKAEPGSGRAYSLNCGMFLTVYPGAQVTEFSQELGLLTEDSAQVKKVSSVISTASLPLFLGIADPADVLEALQFMSKCPPSSF